MKKKIAVVCGGYSSEEVVSMKSADTVLKYIDREKYDPYKIVINKKGWYYQDGEKKVVVNKDDFTVDIHNNFISFDCVFITIHGTPGEDGLLQAYLDLVNIPYTTPGHIPSTITFNKWATNSILRANGYKCASSILLKDPAQLNESEIEEHIGFPCFVKPNDSGSSFGISRVKEVSGLKKAVEAAFKEGSQVLVEALLEGTEVTNGIYSRNGEGAVMAVTEIVPETEFFDFAAKYEGKSQEITPARLSDEITAKIKETTKSIYSLFNLKGIARVDYMIVNDEPYIIEINTTPGLTEQSFIPQQAKDAGISLKELFNIVIEESLRTK